MSTPEFDPTLGLPELGSLATLESRRAVAQTRLAGLSDDVLPIVKDEWVSIEAQLGTTIAELVHDKGLQDTVAQVATEAGAAAIRSLKEVQELSEFVSKERAAELRAAIIGELARIPEVTVAREFFERYGAATKSAASFLQALGGVPLERTAIVIEVPVAAASEAVGSDASAPVIDGAPAAAIETQDRTGPGTTVAELDETPKPDLEVVAGADGILINRTFVPKRKLGELHGDDRVAFIQLVMELPPHKRLQPKDLHRMLYGDVPYNRNHMAHLRDGVNDIFAECTGMRLLIGDGNLGRDAQSLRNPGFRTTNFVDRGTETVNPGGAATKDLSAKIRTAASESGETEKRTLRPILHPTGLKLSKRGRTILYSYHEKTNPPLNDVKIRLQALALIGTRGSIKGSELGELVTGLDGAKLSDNERTKTANWLRNYIIYDREQVVSHNGGHGPTSIYRFSDRLAWGGFGFGADLPEDSPIRQLGQQIEREIRAATIEAGVTREGGAGALAVRAAARFESERPANSGDLFVFVSHLARFNFLLESRGWPTISDELIETVKKYNLGGPDPDDLSPEAMRTRAEAAEKILPLIHDENTLLDFVAERCGDSNSYLEIVDMLSEFSHPSAVTMLRVLSSSKVVHREGKKFIIGSDGLIFWPLKHSRTDYVVPSKRGLQAPAPPVMDDRPERKSAAAAPEKRPPKNLQELRAFIKVAAREFALGADPHDMEALGLDPRGRYALVTIEGQMQRFNEGAVRAFLKKASGNHKSGSRRYGHQLGSEDIHRQKFGLDDVITLLVLKHEKHSSTLKAGGNSKTFDKMLEEEVAAITEVYAQRSARF